MLRRFQIALGTYKKNQRQKQKKAKRSQTSNDGIAELNLLLVAFRIQQETIIAV